MTAKVILNPYSNRWNSKARWPEAEAALKKAGLDFSVVVSERKGHIIELAKKAALDGFSPVIAAGGDGTVGEAVNGLMQAAGSSQEPIGPLGILPTGSANDAAYSLGLPVNLSEAAQVIAAGNAKLMDVGVLNGKYFINNSAAGLEPYVTIKHEKITWIKGLARYLVAAVQGIMDKPEWYAEVRWDGGEYQGMLSLVTIGNGRRTGGFFMTPHADMFDGKLTLAYGYRSTRLGLFLALPRTFKEGAGSYVEMEGMEELHAHRISIKLNKPSPAHTDGELFSEWVQNFEYDILPKKLRILIA